MKGRILRSIITHGLTWVNKPVLFLEVRGGKEMIARSGCQFDKVSLRSGEKLACFPIRPASPALHYCKMFQAWKVNEARISLSI